MHIHEPQTRGRVESSLPKDELLDSVRLGPKGHSVSLRLRDIVLLLPFLNTE